MSVYDGKNIGIVLFENWHAKEHIGSSRIRGHWLMNHWPEAEIFQQGAKYDVVIFQKVYWLEYAKTFQGIKILDIADPDWLDTVPIKEIIDNCDAVTTSTEVLRDEIKKFAGNKPVICIPDRQDLTFHNIYKQHTNEKARKVIWFGYSHNTSVLDKVVGALKKYKLQLTVLSDYRPPYLKADKNLKIDYNNPDFDFNKIILEHDFVVLPPDTRPKGRFKSPNKLYTSWALGMPVATNPQELERFIEPEERKKEAEKRLKEVRELWNIETSVQEFKNLIKQINENRK